MTKRSEVVLTGKKRLLGTLTPMHITEKSNYEWEPINKQSTDRKWKMDHRPMAPSKFLIAAPTAVSNWMTLMPLSSVWNINRCMSGYNVWKKEHWMSKRFLTFGLTMISILRVLSSTTLSMAFRRIHKLLVLKILQHRTSTGKIGINYPTRTLNGSTGPSLKTMLGKVHHVTIANYAQTSWNIYILRL